MNRFMPATAIGLIAGALVAGPALAQSSVSEITVTGKLNDNVRSAVVGYADLDLRTADGMKTLRARIEDSAKSMCSDMGEGTAKGNVGAAPSCVQGAIDDTREQVRLAEISHRDRAVAVVVPAPAPAAEPAEVAEAPPAVAPSAPAAAQPASFTSQTVTNGPVPDTPENRARYGAPMSNAGKRTTPAGN